MPDKIFDMEASAKRLKELCADRGFSVAFIAETLGVSQQAVYSWFQGKKSPSKDHTTELAALLEVRIEEIMRYKHIGEE